MSYAVTPHPHAGQVTLVGAGPGDPELLTLKALRAIQGASVLLVDDLVSDAVLAMATPGTRIVHVGKRGGCKSTPQAFIERLMVQEARSGERVVRLKGGDPFVFGRGGEEMAALRAAGVAVEVVNGLTAGLAAAGALQTPLTHRDHAHGVVFVTGHAQADGATIDWRQLAATAAQARLTLVIYMGVTHAGTIERELLGGGLPADTPVAVLENVSLPRQRQAVGQLAGLAALMARESMSSPAVIVVGDVLRGLAAQASSDRIDKAA